MGDNETAGFDPIFYFHHAFIDYTFQVWQRLWGLTKRGSLTLIDNYPGTVLQEGQPPNFPPGYKITLDTPLIPYERQPGVYYTSNDATDLEELGVAYGPGSLDNILPKSGAKRTSPYELVVPKFPTLVAGSNPEEASPFSLTKWVHNINRADYEGSFVVRLYAQRPDGTDEVEVGREPVLSRWSVSSCSNCQNNLGVDLYVPIHQQTLDYYGGNDIKWRVAIQSRDALRKFTPVLRGGEKDGPQIHDL
jgi:tyrosinase